MWRNTPPTTTQTERRHRGRVPPHPWPHLRWPHAASRSFPPPCTLASTMSFVATPATTFDARSEWDGRRQSEACSGNQERTDDGIDNRAFGTRSLLTSGRVAQRRRPDSSGRYVAPAPPSRLSGGAKCGRRAGQQTHSARFGNVGTWLLRPACTRCGEEEETVRVSSKACQRVPRGA